MSSRVFGFGESLAAFAVPVLNEREVRASAGILFFLALVAFMNAWLVGDFSLTRLFVVAFLADFSIRVFINPKFAPSLVLGRLAVRWQAPEYVGAPQKRFAWGIGWSLALVMLYLVVIQRMIGPVNLLICATCLLLLFFEAAFGICLGCKIFNLFARQPAQHCPGETCAVRRAQPVTLPQMIVTVLFFATLAAVSAPLLDDGPATGDRAARPVAAAMIATPSPTPSPTTPPATPSVTTTTTAADAQGEDCTPPDWAVAMGHAAQWKLHHNCTR